MVPWRWPESEGYGDELAVHCSDPVVLNLVWANFHLPHTWTTCRLLLSTLFSEHSLNLLSTIWAYVHGSIVRTCHEQSEGDRLDPGQWLRNLIWEFNLGIPAHSFTCHYQARVSITVRPYCNADLYHEVLPCTETMVLPFSVAFQIQSHSQGNQKSKFHSNQLLEVYWKFGISSWDLRSYLRVFQTNWAIESTRDSILVYCSLISL